MTGVTPPGPRPGSASELWRDSRLTTGGRMLLILTIALLPLGLIALLASLESMQNGRLRREQDARAMASLSARQLSATISRFTFALRDVTSGFTAATTPEECRAALEQFRRAQRFDAGFAAIDGRERFFCATRGFSGAPLHPATNLFATEVNLASDARMLRFEARDEGRGRYGVGEFPVSTLRLLVRAPALSSHPGITLVQGGNQIVLSSPRAEGRHLTVSAPVAGGQVQLEFVMSDPPIHAVELLVALLPILMWLAAAVIGWIVVNRLMIRPLLQLQEAIEAHDASKGSLVLPRITTPSREIRDLGRAFQSLTEQIKNHESELEEGLARQTKLTREVHHRVKNNLQVVSSLINLHARGITNPDVARAYASIQRRVDALAVVHRNHYAELEENRGVGLRALVGELASNLRATAPSEASHLAITLDVAAVSASQDVAVPISFLITEIVELAIVCAPRDRVTITLALLPDRADRALLRIMCPGIASDACHDHASFERFTRVCEGLSRQLRAKLVRDMDTGSFEIEVAVVG